MVSAWARGKTTFLVQHSHEFCSWRSIHQRWASCWYFFAENWHITKMVANKSPLSMWPVAEASMFGKVLAPPQLFPGCPKWKWPRQMWSRWSGKPRWALAGAKRSYPLVIKRGYWKLPDDCPIIKLAIFAYPCYHVSLPDGITCRFWCFSFLFWCCSFPSLRRFGFGSLRNAPRSRRATRNASKWHLAPPTGPRNGWCFGTSN